MKFCALSILGIVLLFPALAWSVEQWDPAREELTKDTWQATLLEAEEGVRVIYYTVQGSKREELRKSLQQHTPLKIEGTLIPALTEWNVEWEWEYENGEPLFDTTQASVDVWVHFPKWVPPEDAPAELLKRWKRFRVALEQHELGHTVIAKKAQGTIERLIKSDGRRKKNFSRENADALANRIVDGMAFENNMYDKRTGYGRTQGVGF